MNTSSVVEPDATATMQDGIGAGETCAGAVPEDGANLTPAAYPRGRGQALVEYALILALMAVAFGFAIAATGPAIGNVFSNVIFNIGGVDVNESTPLSVRGGNSAAFWQTVEWVRANPQQETPFPTPPNLPAGTVLPTVFASATPTYTLTPTPTLTFTPSDTPTITPSPTPETPEAPTETPEDRLYILPFVDQAREGDGSHSTDPQNILAHWRVDTHGTGTENWTARYFDNVGGTDPALFNPTADVGSELTPTIALTGMPTGTNATDGWGATYTRIFTAGTRTTTFNLNVSGVNGLVRVQVTGQPNVSGNTGFTLNQTYTLAPAQTATVIITVGNPGGAGSLTVNTTVDSVANPDDTASATGTSCGWQGGDNNDLSSSYNRFYFESGSDNGSMPGGRTCYFELRGFINMPGAISGDLPQLSFWDLWDLPAGTSVAVQIGQYVDTAAGAPYEMDRSAANWQTIALRSAGSNYNWTRTQINLNSVAGLNPAITQMTFRFVITTTGAVSNVRYYLDDIQIIEGDSTPPTFNMGAAVWDADSLTQRNDFFFNSDAGLNATFAGFFPVQGFRWNIGTAGAGVTGAVNTVWKLENMANFLSSTSTNTRTYFLEPNRFINLNGAAATDSQGDTGAISLQFWYAMRLQQPGARVVAQWTRDPQQRNGANASTVETWNDISNGVILSATTCTSSCGPNESSLRTVLNMTEVSISVESIPNYNTTPFRIRLAVIVNGGSSVDVDAGVWIDRIRIDRAPGSAYAAYPFTDDAENAAFATANWVTNGAWGRNTSVGAFSTASSYADSPAGNTAAGSSTYYRMSQTIDLLRDTPANGLTYTAASNPYLTFHFRRAVSSAASLLLQIWVEETGTWQTVWSYTGSAPFTQTNFERVDIDLQSAVATSLRLSGMSTMTWATIVSNGATEPIDDDIRIQFVSIGGSTAMGGYEIDDIRIGELTRNVHRLWPTGGSQTSAVSGGGDATLLDTIESVTPSTTSPAAVNDRWLRSGNWGVSTTSWSATNSLSSSPTANYATDSVYMAEFAPIVDLRGVLGTNLPMLEFIARWDVASGDNFAVQIATENTSFVNSAQPYNQLVGWNDWTNATGVTFADAPTTQLTSGRVDSWHRVRVNLSSYAAPSSSTSGQRIRIRFVLTSDSATASTGIMIDDVNLLYSPAPITYANVGTATNWRVEGSWGITAEGGTTTADTMGGYNWTVRYYDCDTLPVVYRSGLCNSLTTYQDASQLILAAFTTEPATGASGAIADDATLSIDTVNGTTPPQGTSGTDWLDGVYGIAIKRVDLVPGTYRFAFQVQGGMRASFSDDATGAISRDNNGTTLASGAYIYDDFVSRTTYTSLTYVDVTVTSTVTKYLVIESLDNWSTNDQFRLSVDSARFNSATIWTDSPNTAPASYTTVPATYTAVNTSPYTYSALVLNGIVNHPTGNRQLRYDARWNLEANQFVYVQYSINGGFTWTTLQPYGNSGSAVNQSAFSGMVGGNPGNSTQLTFRFLSNNVARGASSSGNGFWVRNITFNP